MSMWVCARVNQIVRYQSLYWLLLVYPRLALGRAKSSHLARRICRSKGTKKQPQLYECAYNHPTILWLCLKIGQAVSWALVSLWFLLGFPFGFPLTRPQELLRSTSQGPGKGTFSLVLHQGTATSCNNPTGATSLYADAQ